MKIRSTKWNLDYKGRLDLTNRPEYQQLLLKTFEDVSIHASTDKQSGKETHTFVMGDGKSSVEIEIEPTNIFMSFYTTKMFVPSYIRKVVENLEGKFNSSVVIPVKDHLSSMTNNNYYNTPPRGVTVDTLV